jgi:subtilisin family serine protease
VLRASSISRTAISSPLYSRGSGILASHPEQIQNNPLELVNLWPLMELSKGRAETIIGLIDGPVAIGHPGLQQTSIREIPGKLAGTCATAQSFACIHGTLVAGILGAQRGSAAPAIAPDCTLLIRPIFGDLSAFSGEMPSATPTELAEAITDCVSHGAQVINLSAALSRPTARDASRVIQALDYCGKRGVIVVAAAGNQGTVGSSSITRHPWVIPVVACDLSGRPVGYSNFGNSIGRRGLTAPGHDITSLGADGGPISFGGTSAAAPFVTGAAALLWSEFPGAKPAQMRFALLQGNALRRAAIVPTILDAWASYQILKRAQA